MLRIYNTLHRKIEEFNPINPPNVGMYICGPTVYDYAHIGNLRSFIFYDILRRVLKYNGYKVKVAENITDIDDKIIKRAVERNTAIEKIASQYTNLFLSDVAKLNIENPDFQPKATEYINKMIEYIQDLIRKGFAYQEEDGSVYFDISKFVDYGELSNIEKRELKTRTRILSDEYTKQDVQDFALWKGVKENEVGFDSPWGRGRPGWHIECSVMSQTILGDCFDIHTGGVDLIFPHHENEIAQSEAKTGKKPFVKYWVHGAHMLVDGQKMSKSLGNFYTLSDLEKKGFNPLSLRYLYLQTHYRQEMNFTWESLTASQNALNKLYDEVSGFGEAEGECPDFEKEFLDAVNEDLNMPKALAVVWEMVKSENLPSAKLNSLFKMDEVLGLNLKQVKNRKVKTEEKEIPLEVLELAKEREALRKQNRFHLADQIRNRIKKMGFEIEDKNGKTIIRLL